MNLLLDTHALIWMATGDPQLSAGAIATIVAPGNDAFVSAVSFYEIELKRRRGQMPAHLPVNLQAVCELEGYRLIDVTPEDAADAARLPDHHRDPWDRVLVAQAMRRSMIIVTKDREFGAYGVPVLW